MDIFRERDTITSLADLDETTAPDGFQFKKSKEHALFFNLVFDKETKFAKIENVQLQHIGIPERLDELNNRQFLKPKGRPPYSIEMIHYGLHLRHTSFQGYKQLLEEFPLPSFSTSV